MPPKILGICSDFLMPGLKLQATADMSDPTAKDLIWLLFDTSLPIFGVDPDEAAQFDAALSLDVESDRFLAPVLCLFGSVFVLFVCGCDK